MRRWLSGLSALVGGWALAGPGSGPIAIADARIDVQPGWVEVSRDGDKATLSTADKRQWVTITHLGFAAAPTREDFKRLCDHRIEAERMDGPDVFVRSEPPFDSDGSLVCFYSGGNKATSRVFSGYLSLSHKQLVTVYVEGLGVAPKAHLDAFTRWVAGVHRAP